jgi:hypothetical protein
MNKAKVRHEHRMIRQWPVFAIWEFEQIIE